MQNLCLWGYKNGSTSKILKRITMDVGAWYAKGSGKVCDSIDVVIRTIDAYVKVICSYINDLQLAVR